MRMTGRDWGLLILLSLLWGGAFFFSKIAVGAIGPLTTAACRVSLAALVLLAVVRLGGHRMPTGAAALGAFLVMGMLNNAIPFTLIFWGQTHIDSSLAAILNAMTPVFAVLIAHVATRDEALTPAKGLGVAVALGGVILLIGPAALGGLTAAGWGMLAVLAAGVSYACAGIYGRRFKDLPVQVAAAGMLCGSSVLLIPTAVVVERPWVFDPGAVQVAAVVGLALLSTALAYLLYFRILQSAGATNVALVTFLIPVSALALGVLILGERLEPLAFGGMALIFAGLGIIDGRLQGAMARRLRGLR